MSRVTFQFKNGTTRQMLPIQADVLAKRGLGTYLTRDMVADRTPPTIATTEGPELDSSGIAWDADLHVASRLKNNNGTWRKKPGAAAAQADE